MKFDDLSRRAPPVPWSGVHKIPWHDEAFSRRMLAEHLDQSHDRASRKQAVIEAQVDYLATSVLPENARVLDLGCGPGLYCRELAQRGYRCTGMDYSPASIEYARDHDPDSVYRLADVLEVDLESGFDMAMMLYGEFQTFPPATAERLLGRMKDAVFPDGAVVLEVQTAQVVHAIGRQPSTWRAMAGGLFCETPHVWLKEHFWLDDERVAVTRHYVLDEAGSVTEYADTLQSYAEHEFVELFQRLGFRRIARQSSLSSDPGCHFMIGYCA